MEDENLTQEAQVDESQLNSATGENEADSEPVSFTLEEINKLTGKQYKSKESALKSIEDMSKMAGKAADLLGKDKKLSETKTEYEERIAALETEAFLARNPQHESNLDLLQMLAKAEGVSLRQASELPAYQKVLEGQKTVPDKRTVADPQRRVQKPKEPDITDVLGDAQKSGEYVAQHFFNK